MPYDFDLEHPEIRCIERTGYPSFAQPEVLRCEVCDKELRDSEAYEDDNHEFLCKECLLYLHEKGW